MKQIFESLNLNLSKKQLNKFNLYYDFLISENKKYNLTAITDKREVFIKHFYDALTPVLTGVLRDNMAICDIGSGAGFPGIPLKILLPQVKLTIIESSTKKTTFLKTLIKMLDLEDVMVINKRAENYAVTNQNKFDLVIARAVAPLNILLELCVPLVKVGAYFIAMKSLSYKDELDQAKNGIILLGAKLVDIFSLQLPEGFGKRNLLLFEKLKHEKGYPRSFAKIKKNPL